MHFYVNTYYLVNKITAATCYAFNKHLVYFSPLNTLTLTNNEDCPQTLEAVTI